MAKKVTAPKLVMCYECKHAYLMRNPGNPIIAECSVKKERFVAKVSTECAYYEANRKEKVINYMIPAKL